jgi:site-specific DNA-cytosine methylase
LEVAMVSGIDASRIALGVVEHNFSHPVMARNIETLNSPELARLAADIWWMSPPCQPYTQRGLGRELDDPRARSFQPLLDLIERVGPPCLGFENVPGFETSKSHELFLAMLERTGYEVREGFLCPSELGLPNRRRRYFLIASRCGWASRSGWREEESPFHPQPSAASKISLAACLATGPAAVAHQDPAAWEALRVPDSLLRRYEGALDILAADDPEAVSACFTAAYGRSHVRSGSYLRDAHGVRRFSPAEILSLLGFPASYTLPPSLPLANAWRLVGNSLSLPVVRRVLGALPLLVDV